MCREVVSKRVHENNDDEEEEERFHVTNSLMENRMQHKNSYHHQHHQHHQQQQQKLLLSSSSSSSSSSLQNDSKYRKTMSNKLTQLWLLLKYHGKRQWQFLRKYRYLWIVIILMVLSSYQASSIVMDIVTYAKLKKRSKQSVQLRTPQPQNKVKLHELSILYQELYPHITSVTEEKDFWNIPRTSPQYKALSWLSADPSRQHNTTALVQRYALATLYFSTHAKYLPTTHQSKKNAQKRGFGGNEWGVQEGEVEGWKKQFNFLSHDLNECQWNDDGGVRQCNAKGEITDISLWNNLVGTIPAEIGLLTNLQVLYLARNRLMGTIPTTIGLLTELKYAGLQYNQLTGTVPSHSFANLVNLQTLHLERNDLTGLIRRVDPLCQLKEDATDENEQKSNIGTLKALSADCRELVAWKGPEITCGCCTECYRF